MNKVNTIGKAAVMAAFAVVATLVSASAAFAQEGGALQSPFAPVGAGLAIGLAVFGGAMGQGKAVSSMLEAFGRNPSVGGRLLAPMLIGMALIESLVILAFVIALRTL